MTIKHTILCLVLVLTTQQLHAAVPNPVADAEELIQKGLPKDAFDKLQPWILDEKSTDLADKQAVPKGIEMAVNCLGRLNRMDEVDDFLEQAVVVHRKNWRVLEKIAQQIGNRIPHGGVMVDNRFQRDSAGRHNAAGQRVDATDRDRVRSLQLFVEAMPLARLLRDCTNLPIFVLTSNYDVDKRLKLSYLGADRYDHLFPLEEHNVLCSLQCIQTQNSIKNLGDMTQTFMRLGGQELQINVVDREELLKAQKNPQEYANLVVRVAGYSAFFVTLPTDVQDEIIARTEQQTA